MKTTYARIFLLVLATTVGILGDRTAMAKENAGNVIAARRQAWAERGSTQDSLSSKSEVFSGDILSTNPVGRLQVLFRDDSVLMMAPDTRTTVTEYVYDSGGKPAFNLSVAQGVDRLISGRITEADPSAMSVETPQAVVGIQGTEVQISSIGDATEISLLRGTAGKPLTIYSKVHNTSHVLDINNTSMIIRGSQIEPPKLLRMSSSALSALSIT